MNNDLVSVVVPIYNVEKYLDRCINSIVNQTYTNLEIILVDDGSPDNCHKMCDDWANKDKRIKVIHKKNAGLGMARNSGIDNASGKYICFFDSDDYVDTTTIEKCINRFNETNADIVYFGHYSVDKDENIIKEYKPNSPKGVYDKEEIRNYLLPEMIAKDHSSGQTMNLMLSSCSALYTMQSMNKYHWRFVSERDFISEDIYSLLSLFSYVDKIAVVDYALYYYRQNNSSLSRSYKSDRFDRTKEFFKDAINLSDKLNYPYIVKQRLSNLYVEFVLAVFKTTVRSSLTNKEKKQEFKRVIKDNYNEKILPNVDYKILSKGEKTMYQLLRHKQVLLSYLILSIRYK